MTLYRIVDEDDELGQHEPTVVEVSALPDGEQILRFGTIQVPVVIEDNTLKVLVGKSSGDLSRVDTLDALHKEYEQDDTLKLLYDAGMQEYSVIRPDEATYLLFMQPGEAMTVERHDTRATLPQIGHERILG